MLPPESSVCCCWGREKQNRYFPPPEITGREASTGGFLMTHPVRVLAIYEPSNELTNETLILAKRKNLEFYGIF